MIIYPGSWKRFSKPKRWIEFLVVTMLAGLLLGSFIKQGVFWNPDGLLTGIQMTIRAAYMIVAFNVISIELRNPTIIEWFLRMGFGQLAVAMEVAFEALPTAIAALGEQRHVLRHPIESLSRLLVVARDRLSIIENAFHSGGNVFILTGDKRSGKTSFLSDCLQTLKKENIRVGGILSPAVHDGTTRIGFDVMDILSQTRVPLCRTTHNPDNIKLGDYYFHPNGIRFGNNALSLNGIGSCELVIIDEVGPLELDGKGWAESLDKIIPELTSPLLIVVRESLIKAVSNRWDFTPAIVWKYRRETGDILMRDVLYRFHHEFSKRASGM